MKHGDFPVRELLVYHWVDIDFEQRSPVGERRFPKDDSGGVESN